jgi:hypothetical protein
MALVNLAAGRSLGAIDVLGMIGAAGIAAAVALRAARFLNTPDLVERHV